MSVTMKLFHSKIWKSVAVAMVVVAGAAGCADDSAIDPALEPMSPDEQQRVHAAWRVDMIVGTHPEFDLLAEYSYDEMGRLVQANLSEHGKPQSRQPGVGSQFEERFVWKNGLMVGQLTRMQYLVDGAAGIFEHSFDTTYEYDDKGNLLHAGGEGLYGYDDQGRLVQTYRYEFGGMIYRDMLEWDERGNITRHICEGPEAGPTGAPVAGSYRKTVFEYEYDNNPKPNFGLGTAFFGEGRYSPWPHAADTDELLARALSRNNLIRCEASGVGYRYTYNEQGLPATVEPHRIGAAARSDLDQEPQMVQTIVYKPFSTN